VPQQHGAVKEILGELKESKGTEKEGGVRHGQRKIVNAAT